MLKLKNLTVMKCVFLQLNFLKAKFRPFCMKKKTVEFAENEKTTVFTENGYKQKVAALT